MSKIPCGGFYLGESLFLNDKNELNANEVFMIHYNVMEVNGDNAFDKTWDELVDAYLANKIILLSMESPFLPSGKVNLLFTGFSNFEPGGPSIDEADGFFMALFGTYVMVLEVYNNNGKIHQNNFSSGIIMTKNQDDVLNGSLIIRGEKGVNYLIKVNQNGEVVAVEH